jgi:hypothetical protein
MADQESSHIPRLKFFYPLANSGITEQGYRGLSQRLHGACRRGTIDHCKKLKKPSKVR